MTIDVMNTDDQCPATAGVESPTGSVQGRGFGNTDPDRGRARRVGDHESGESDAGAIAVGGVAR
jgi:hypothetical protein